MGKHLFILFMLENSQTNFIQIIKKPNKNTHFMAKTKLEERQLQKWCFPNDTSNWNQKLE